MMLALGNGRVSSTSLVGDARWVASELSVISHRHCPRCILVLRHAYRTNRRIHHSAQTPFQNGRTPHRERGNVKYGWNGWKPLINPSGSTHSPVLQAQHGLAGKP